MPIELTDTNLQTQQVYLQSFTQEHLTYIDAQQRMIRRPITNFVHISQLKNDEISVPEDVGIIEFVDGQRIRGKFVNDIQTVDGNFYWDCIVGNIWDDAGIQSNVYRRTIKVNLDEIKQITFAKTINETKNVTEDIIRFSNDETATGFVINIKDNKIDFQISGHETPIVIPTGKIHAIILMNMSKNVQGSAYLVRLKDGTRLRTENIELNNNHLELAVNLTGQEQQSIRLNPLVISEIDILKSGYELMYLENQELISDPQRNVFGKAYSVDYKQRILRLHAPAELSYQLPDGAVKLIATAELDEVDSLPQLAEWADMNLHLYTNENHNQYHLNFKQKIHHINLPLLGAKKLEIKLDQGLNGPVLDRLKFMDAKLLVQIKRENPSHLPNVKQ